jgi:isopentenyldiphosphate isomerase
MVHHITPPPWPWRNTCLSHPTPGKLRSAIINKQQARGLRLKPNTQSRRCPDVDFLLPDMRFKLENGGHAL